MTIIIVPNEPNPNMTGRHYGVAKALSVAGHDVHTLMWDLPHQMNRTSLLRHLFTSLHTRTYTYEDLTLHKIARLPLFWPFINGWLFKRQVRKLYKDLGVDMIFAQSYTNETRIPSELPYIYDLADDYAAPAQVYGSAVYKLAFKILGVRRSMEVQARNALAVTAVSDVLVTWAKPFNSLVTKLPNGVETDIITKIVRTKSVSKPKPQSLIYVSGFGPWSQPLKVMQAVKNLRQEYPKISLTLVGEGSEVSAIKQFITDNDAASYIEYRGFVHDRNKVFELINQHEIGLNISEKNIWRDAAHPMKVVEYSALGKKVVSTDLAGVKALDQPNIFMFSNEEPNGIEKAIKAVLASSKTNYAAISKATLQDYDWKQIESKLEAIIVKAKAMASRPQVVHVTPSYPPVLGGLEKVVAVLAKTQIESGLKVSVLTSRPKNISQYFDLVPVQRFRNFIAANTIVMPHLLPKLMLVNKNKIVHLHVTQAFTPEMVWIGSKIKGFKYVAHIHLDVAASGAAGFLLKYYKQFFLKTVLRSAVKVIVFTEDQRTNLCKAYGLPEEKVAVIPNGVEEIYFNKDARTVHKKPRLLFVGRLGYQKNLPFLFKSLVGISDKFDTFIVGNGEEENKLKATVRDLKLQNVRFVGRTDGDELLTYYKNSDIFVLPSEREGMPLVLLEAMAMGLPIVATDVTGNRDLVSTGKNGLLVKLGDVDGFRVALEKAAGTSTYQKLSIGSSSASRQYRWLNLVSQFEKIYGMSL